MFTLVIAYLLSDRARRSSISASVKLIRIGRAGIGILGGGQPRPRIIPSQSPSRPGGISRSDMFPPSQGTGVSVAGGRDLDKKNELKLPSSCGSWRDAFIVGIRRSVATIRGTGTDALLQILNRFAYVIHRNNLCQIGVIIQDHPRFIASVA